MPLDREFDPQIPNETYPRRLEARRRGRRDREVEPDLSREEGVFDCARVDFAGHALDGARAAEGQAGSHAFGRFEGDEDGVGCCLGSGGGGGECGGEVEGSEDGFPDFVGGSEEREDGDGLA